MVLDGKKVRVTPVNHHPFLQVTPVEHDPFKHGVTPVNHDPFEKKEKDK